MIVVSNTSPLNYMILVEAVDVLPRLFGQIQPPTMVQSELRAAASPLPVRAWASDPPAWVQRRTPLRPDTSLQLHPGETHAIALAEELSADLLLIDDRRGTCIARSRGLKTMGLIGLLDRADEQGCVDVAVVIRRLDQTNFRMTAALCDYLLVRHSRRSVAPPEPLPPPSPPPP